MEVTILWEVLSQQTVHVFVCTALPSGIGMRKEELEFKGLGNVFVFSKLFAVIGSQGMDLVFDGQEQVANLLALLLTRGPIKPEATQQERIVMLASAGLPAKQIADVLETTVGTVQARLSEAKKAKQKKAKSG